MSARPDRRKALVGLSVFAFATYSGLARADPLLVFVGVQTGSREGADELSNRVRGELVADGFRVEPVRPVAPAERMAFVRENGRGAAGPIAVGLFIDEDSEGLGIYLVDTLSGRTAVRYNDRPAPDEPPEVVARHAVDLLRASLLDFAIRGLRDAAASPKREAPAAHVGSGGDVSPRRWAMEGGVGVVAGFAGVGASVAPVLRLRFALNRFFQLRLTGAGLGSNPSVQTDRGNATVQQAVVLADGTAVLGQSRWIRPFAVLGGGIYYVGVTGTGIPPYQGESGQAIAFAVDGGIGLSASITPSLDLSLEAHAVVALPGVAVRFVDEEAARVGQPALLVTLTLADWI
jgi:hypothetical protein